MGCLLFVVRTFCSGRTVVWRWFPYQAPKTEALATSCLERLVRSAALPVSKDPEVIVAAISLNLTRVVCHGRLVRYVSSLVVGASLF
jgi:hypothetical protein